MNETTAALDAPCAAAMASKRAAVSARKTISAANASRAPGRPALALER